jgi:hypothetical protein
MTGVNILRPAKRGEMMGINILRLGGEKKEMPGMNILYP